MKDVSVIKFSSFLILYCPNINAGFVEAITIAPFPEPLSTIAATFRGEMWQLSGCILVVGLDYQSTKVFPLIDSYYILYTL